MQDHIVKRQIEIRATPDQVWNALTDPEKTKHYFFNAKVYSDWKVGSPITFKGRMFLILKFEMTGTVLEIDRPRHLKYNLRNSGSSTLSTVTDTLNYHNGVTTLTITDDVGAGEGGENRFKKSGKGWDKILAGLKKLVEEENEPAS